MYTRTSLAPASGAISPSDTLLVSITGADGSTILLTLDGARGMGDVMRKVRSSMAPDSTGAARISLRNRTQGWTTRHTVVLTSAPAPDRHAV